MAQMDEVVPGLVAENGNKRKWWLNKNRTCTAIYIFIGSFILMLPAFYNGFPIVYSDTSTYIASGMQLEAPFDRPITYGLFLRLFSLNGTSLWFVIWVQAALLAILIFSAIKQLCMTKLYRRLSLLVILFLTFCSGLAWTVCQLMPDIFSSVAVLCVCLILLFEWSILSKICLYTLFLVSVAMHISHILMFVAILGVVFIFAKYTKRIFNKDIKQKRILILAALAVGSALSMGSATSKSRHVFFMGAMVEHGILKQFLDENCTENHYKFCQYKDSLPELAFQFIWEPQSPFYKMGGWKETKSEFNSIIYSTLTRPKYIGLHIKASLVATFDQLLRFKVGDGNGSFLAGTQLNDRVANYFPSDHQNYVNSKQNQQALSIIPAFNIWFTFIFALSSIFLLLVLLTNRASMQPFQSFFFIIIIAIILNAWTCGTFANAIDRMGAKIVWLIPFVAIILLLQLRLKQSGRK
jgi:hypothetical protein